MGLQDRDYHRKNAHREDGFLSQLTPVVKWLLILNLGFYAIDVFFENPDGGKPIREFGAFAIQSAVYEFRIWEFITFQFIHGSMGHVILNSLGIFFFGPWLERWWGSRKFLIFYLLCGMGGAAFFMLLAFLGILPGANLQSPLVGASAGIYGIFIGVAVIAPNLRVSLLFPPIELSMRNLAIALMAVSTGAIIFKLGGNEGGEAGHLGGAIVGFLIMRYPMLLGAKFQDAPAPERTTAPRPLSKLRPRTDVELNQDSAVDKILDKISREGFQSLTQAERDFLQKVSESKKSS